MSVPFDSYSPLTPGKRGRKNAGLRILKDKSYYSCCAAIGAVGVGVFLRHMVLADKGTVTVCFYEQGEIKLVGDGIDVTLTMETAYPADLPTGSLSGYPCAPCPFSGTVHFVFQEVIRPWKPASPL
jgi:hypothetical protein